MKKKIPKTNNKNISRSQNKKIDKYIKPVKSEIKSIGLVDKEISKSNNEFVKKSRIKDNENLLLIEIGKSITEIISISSDESCKKKEEKHIISSGKELKDTKESESISEIKPKSDISLKSNDISIDKEDIKPSNCFEENNKNEEAKKEKIYPINDNISHNNHVVDDEKKEIHQNNDSISEYIPLPEDEKKEINLKNDNISEYIPLPEGEKKEINPKNDDISENNPQPEDVIKEINQKNDDISENNPQPEDEIKEINQKNDNISDNNQVPEGEKKEINEKNDNISDNNPQPEDEIKEINQKNDNISDNNQVPEGEKKEINQKNDDISENNPQPEDEKKEINQKNDNISDNNQVPEGEKKEINRKNDNISDNNPIPEDENKEINYINNIISDNNPIPEDENKEINNMNNNISDNNPIPGNEKKNLNTENEKEENIPMKDISENIPFAEGKKEEINPDNHVSAIIPIPEAKDQKKFVQDKVNSEKHKFPEIEKGEIIQMKNNSDNNPIPQGLKEELNPMKDISDNNPNQESENNHIIIIKGKKSNTKVNIAHKEDSLFDGCDDNIPLFDDKNNVGLLINNDLDIDNKYQILFNKSLDLDKNKEIEESRKKELSNEIKEKMQSIKLLRDSIERFGCNPVLKNLLYQEAKKINIDEYKEESFLNKKRQPENNINRELEQAKKEEKSENNIIQDPGLETENNIISELDQNIEEPGENLNNNNDVGSIDDLLYECKLEHINDLLYDINHDSLWQKDVKLIYDISDEIDLDKKLENIDLIYYKDEKEYYLSLGKTEEEWNKLDEKQKFIYKTGFLKAKNKYIYDKAFVGKYLFYNLNITNLKTSIDARDMFKNDIIMDNYIKNIKFYDNLNDLYSEFNKKGGVVKEKYKLLKKQLDLIINQSIKFKLSVSSSLYMESKRKELKLDPNHKKEELHIKNFNSIWKKLPKIEQSKYINKATYLNIKNERKRFLNRIFILKYKDVYKTEYDLFCDDIKKYNNITKRVLAKKYWNLLPGEIKKKYKIKTKRYNLSFKYINDIIKNLLNKYLKLHKDSNPFISENTLHDYISILPPEKPTNLFAFYVKENYHIIKNENNLKSHNDILNQCRKTFYDNTAIELKNNYNNKAKKSQELFNFRKSQLKVNGFYEILKTLDEYFNNYIIN